jgi:hypothetical protein
MAMYLIVLRHTKLILGIFQATQIYIPVPVYFRATRGETDFHY